MKKLLFLFAVLLTSVGAWAQTFTLQKSRDEVNPEYQYFIQNANSVFMDSQTSFVSTAKSNSSGKFAFFAYVADGATENDVLIYSIDANKWVSYTKAGSYDNKTDFVELVENKENANPWRFSENTNGSEAVYQFAPHNNTGIASKYMNWYGGVSNTEKNKTVGIYSTAANSDNGSAWILWPVNGKWRCYLKDVHNKYLNLSVLGQEPDHAEENKLATLTQEQAALYISVVSNGRWQIHTEENGGNYLKQSPSSRAWCSWVSEGAEDFYWTPEYFVQNGKRYLVLRNADGKETGYLAGDKHTAGSPLYVNSNNDAQKLKLKMIDGNAEFAHITYKFIYRGEEKGTEEYYMPVGVALPGIQTIFPDYITCSSVPSGNIDNSCNGKIYEINLYDEMPFQVSDSYENAVWYYMNIRSTGSNQNKPNKWVEMSNSGTYTNRYGTKPTTDEAKWAFIGNPFDGIKVINKAAGANKTLSLNGDNIVMKDGQKVWNLQKGTGGFVLQAEKNTNIYAHDYGGNLKTWDDGSAKTDAGSAFNVIDVRSDALEYATNVILGSRITNLADIQDGQTVVFKSVPHSKYINISTALETGISSTLSGLSVFKIHVVDAESKKYTFESCKEGYYFPDITSGGKQNCIMEQADNPNQYTVLSEATDNETTLSEGQFVIKSLGTNGGYFDVQEGNDFCGWQGKGNNSKYEIYPVTVLGTTSAGTVNHCVLTDDNNNIYQFDYWALPGTNPTISGIPSSCITNGSMNDKTYTAHVTFPFPASSTNQINPTMISSFKSGYADGYQNTYKWYAKNDNEVWVSRGVLPDVANLDAYSWAIYPELVNGTFSFAIKNLATDKYVSTTADYAQNGGASGVVTLEKTHTPKYYTLGNNGYLSYIGTTNKISQYLSAGGSGNNDQALGVWAKEHNGATNSFLSISYTKTISSDGVTTLFTPYAVEIPDGVTVKYVEASKNPETTGNIKYTELTGSIPANTAVLLEGFAGTYTFNSTEEYVDALEDNILFGYSEKTEVSASEHKANVYNLTYKKGRIAFFKYEGTEYQAYAAYLDVTSLNVQGTPEYFNVVDMSNYFVLQTSVEGWTENNPNTHLGTITLTNGENTVARKMEASALDNYYYKLDKSLNTTLALTRKYRGYEFLGFWLGETELGLTPTLIAEQVNAVNEANPIIAKYKPTDEVTLFYDDDPFSYRIPAIGKTSTGRLIAVSDYRYSLDDIGRYNFGTANPGIDLVVRMSDDNGKTWGETKTIAKGSCKLGADDCAYGDAAIAVVGEKVLVMGAAGDVMFGNGSATAHNRTVRIISEDGGENWTAPQDISETFFINANATINSAYSLFFGSGKLAVDENYNGTGNARIYGAVLVKKNGTNNGIYVVYTDDFGLTWSILGGSQTHLASNDEPKVEILPSGQILLSIRRKGGRQFNVFTYSNKATNAGFWNGNADGCSNGGENTCNGEIFLVDAKKADGSDVKLLLQSQPKGGSGLYDRRDVTIWYKEVDNTSYTSSQIAGNWIEGMQVSTQQSAYSTMSLQKEGKIAFFFEEAPCYGDDQAKGYCMVYLPLTIEEITKNKYFSLNADFTTERNISVVLTDAQGNEYRDQFESTLPGVATTLEGKYPFITLGDNATLEPADGENFTYTNTVTLPFKVSNNENTYWHNIYFPANGLYTNYPVYMMANGEGDIVKTSIKENSNHGAQSMNTYDNADKISWAIYHAGEGFAFRIKNKQEERFVKVGTLADGRSQNTEYTGNINEATAFELVDGRNDSYEGDFGLSYNGGQLITYSVDDKYVSYSKATGHQGGWVKIVEAPDFETLFGEIDAAIESVSEIYGPSLGQYHLAGDLTLETIRSAMENSNELKLNVLLDYKEKLNAPLLNMPKDGQFFRVAYDYGNAGRLYMQSTASSEKGLEFTEATGAASIWVYYDKALYSYTEGQCLRETGNDRGLQAVGGKTTATFSASTRVKGKYNLQCDSYVHANANNGKYYTDHCSGNNCVQHDLILEEVASLPFTFKKAGLGFATFNAPVPVELPKGVLAYVTQIKDNNTLQMSRLEDKVVPANTPVMLYNEEAKAGDAQDETTIELVIVDAYTGDEFEKFDYEKSFYGTIAAEPYPTDYTIYSLRKSAGKNTVGFYQKASGNLGGFKAWIKISKSKSPQAFTIFFDGDDATGLKEALGLENENVEIYDLSGRRLDKPAKGVNIVGGKLVIK